MIAMFGLPIRMGAQNYTEWTHNGTVMTALTNGEFDTCVIRSANINPMVFRILDIVGVTYDRMAYGVQYSPVISKSTLYMLTRYDGTSSLAINSGIITSQFSRNVLLIAVALVRLQSGHVKNSQLSRMRKQRIYF